MKPIDFVNMILDEKLDRSRVQILFCDDYEQQIPKALGIDIHGDGVEYIHNAPIYLWHYVGVVRDDDAGTLQDVRFAAGYTPNVEYQKDGTSWCLYDLGEKEID